MLDLVVCVILALCCFNHYGSCVTFLEVGLTPLHIGAPRGYMRDEGGPLGIGLQEQIPNHLKLLW